MNNTVITLAIIAGIIFLGTFIFVGKGLKKDRKKKELKAKLAGPRTSFKRGAGLVKLEINVVGMHYRGIDFPFECDARLKLDLENKYDPNAVAVYSDTGVHVGFLPKGDSIFHKLLSYGVEVKGYVSAWEPTDSLTKKLFAKFYAQVPSDLVKTMQEVV